MLNTYTVHLIYTKACIFRKFFEFIGIFGWLTIERRISKGHGEMINDRYGAFSLS